MGHAWASWKHVISQLEKSPTNKRLENASWRAWAKLRNNLETVPAALIDWFKDNDVNWLYGPWLSGLSSPDTSQPWTPDADPTASVSSQNTSLRAILRKRSLLHMSYGYSSFSAQGRKFVRFDDRVQQCIVVEDGGNDASMDARGWGCRHALPHISAKRPWLLMAGSGEAVKPAGIKTIVTLPTVDLKREDDVELPTSDVAARHSWRPLLPWQ